MHVNRKRQVGTGSPGPVTSTALSAIKRPVLSDGTYDVTTAMIGVGGGVKGHMLHDSALSVGSSSKEEDMARIRELEEEVRDLIDRTATASQRFADYENEIRVLNAKLRQEQRKNGGAVNIVTPGDSPINGPGLSRWGSFMTRKPSATAVNSPTTLPTGPREKALEEKLVVEQTARIAAEQRAKEVHGEIEELSASLFQQANEMVATERRENARLVERIQALEKRRGSLHEAKMAHQENQRLKEKIKTLEQREADRKRRLERLEAANKRIERVRAMLVPR